MVSILGVSVNCMTRFDNTMNEKIDLIKSTGVEGIELSGEDILEQGNKGTDNIDGRTKELLDSFRYKSIHMPFGKLTHGADGEAGILEKIKPFAIEFGIDVLVFHPMQISDYSVFGNDGIDYGIENMSQGKDKKGYQTVEDIRRTLSKNGNVKLVFDACHSLANGIDPIEFLGLEDSICEMHISARGEMGDNRDHRLMYKASKEMVEKIVPALKISKPAIIESVMDNEEEMRNEVKFVRELAKRF